VEAYNTNGICQESMNLLPIFGCLDRTPMGDLSFDVSRRWMGIEYFGLSRIREGKMKLVSVSEMKAIEKQADEIGLTYATMMKNAGAGLAAEIQKIHHESQEPKILGLVGIGNNGGDCLVALTILQSAGWNCTAYPVKPREPDDTLTKDFQAAGGTLLNIPDSNGQAALERSLREAEFLVDGVLGTGIRLPLHADIAEALGGVKTILASLTEKPTVVAVDCPSGVDCDSGAAADEAIPADITVCMAAVKQGLLQFPAFELAGVIKCVEIGLPADLPEWQKIQRVMVDETMVRAILPHRSANSHKGTYGSALIVAGSVNYSGSVILAGEAAYRIGAGLVTLAVPAPLHAALASALPEATWMLLPNEMGVISAHAAEVVRKNLGKATAVLLGSGWGMEETTQHFLERLLQGKSAGQKPSIGFIHASIPMAASVDQVLPGLVIDADGLKLLPKIEEWWKLVPSGTVLTPHPGEMAILTGLETREIQENRLQIAEKYAKEWDKVVVLKGACTIISDPMGRTAVIPVATSALAKAGTGDVLAGAITGLRAQGVDPFEAAVAAAWIHAEAGLAAADTWGSEASVLAGDVVLGIAEIMGRFRD
jgi:NAD(P)H-hydrate epimerase